MALLVVALPSASGQDAVGEWKAAGALSSGRYAPGAALLTDGRVVVAGGYSFEADRTYASSDVFDPGKGEWSSGPALRFDRNFPVVLGLAGGEWLFAGGFHSGAGTTATCERLYRNGERFTCGAAESAPPLVEERELFAAVPLRDGRVLVTGGYSTLRRRTLDSAELYDPVKKEFTAAKGRMRHARFGHASVLLPDGKVLVVGGKVLGTNDDVLSAELYNPAKDRFAETGSLAAGRDRCTAWTLPGGKEVIVAGGSAREGGTVAARRSEVYRIRDGAFRAGPELLRDRMAHTMTTLPDGGVLIVGGWSNSEGATARQAELWDPKAGSFVAAGLLQAGRHDHCAVLMKGAPVRVLVAGGKEAPAREGVETPLGAEMWIGGRDGGLR